MVGAVDGAVVGAVGDAVRDAVRGAVLTNWSNYIGGQFWCGGRWYGGAWSSFFREVCGLTLGGDLWDRAKAYEATMESACWWWPHLDFVIVSERPTEIHREQVGPRGWGSHRLHYGTGPAISFQDGWSIYAWHGVQVPAKVILHPEQLTPTEIMSEPNDQVRMAMLERFGFDRFICESGAKSIDKYANQFSEYELVEIPDRAWGHIKAVKMQCPSTGAIFVLPTSPQQVSVAAAMDEIKGVKNYFDRVQIQT